MFCKVDAHAVDRLTITLLGFSSVRVKPCAIVHFFCQAICSHLLWFLHFLFVLPHRSKKDCHVVSRSQFQLRRCGN